MHQRRSTSRGFRKLAGAILGGFERLLFLLGMAAMWGIVGLVFMQVAFRYLLQTGLPWTEEVSRYLHITLVFLALAYVLRTNSHLRVDVLFLRLPKPFRTFSFVMFLVLQLTASAVIVYGGINLVERLGHTRTPAVGMPLAMFFLPTVLGFAALALECIRQIVATVLSLSRFEGSSTGLREEVS